MQIIMCNRSQSQSDNSRKYMKGLIASIKTKDDDADYHAVMSFEHLGATWIIGQPTFKNS